jgi:hypothetical protein
MGTASFAIALFVQFVFFMFLARALAWLVFLGMAKQWSTHPAGGI